MVQNVPETYLLYFIARVKWIRIISRTCCWICIYLPTYTWYQRFNKELIDNIVSLVISPWGAFTYDVMAWGEGGRQKVTLVHKPTYVVKRVTRGREGVKNDENKQWCHIWMPPWLNDNSWYYYKRYKITPACTTLNPWTIHWK